MFRNFFIPELKYTLKQPMVYIFMGLMALLTFGATVSDNIQIGGTVGNVFKNAPHIITIYTTILTIFGLLIATAFFNNAALRDYQNDFHEIIFSAPIDKAGYFFGRFFGALMLSTLPMLGVFIGVYIGSIVAPIFNWVSSDRFGGFYMETIFMNYFLFVLPNMFFAGTIIFAIAQKWKSTVFSFVGSLIIVVGYIISGTLISDMDNETVAALTDTFGIRAYFLSAKYYTPIEKNNLSPSFSGLLLYNRIIWIAVGVVLLIFAYFRFSFKEKSSKSKPIKESKAELRKAATLPDYNIIFNGKTDWTQFKSFFVINFLSITKSPTFVILFLFSAIILIANLLGGFEYFGLQSYPLTYKLIDTINGSTAIFVIIILVFYSGELIWRDRDTKINEVIDATPHTSIISMMAKSLSLFSIAALLHVFFIFCGLVFQLLQGYTRIELDVYFADFLISSLPAYVVWSGVMIFIQVLTSNKYVGYFVSILIVFIWGIMLSIFDVESNMLSIGAGPATRYSDMNGFGPGLYGALVFNAYWILFSLICLLMSGLLWNRGMLSSLMTRFQIMKKQAPAYYLKIIVGCGVCWFLLAGFVFYNTQILNKYKTGDGLEKLSAEYEKKYKKYEGILQPKISEINYFIDIFPNKRNVLVKANMKLTNETDQRIDSIHYNVDDTWEPEINIPNSTLVMNDEEMGYRIYKLENSLKPGETIAIELKTKYISKGFENQEGNTNIARNGTFLNNFQILPSLGYISQNELSDKNTRKKHGLSPKDRMPKLQANCTQNCMRNYLTNGIADFINVETVISTSSDQTAIAPGSLIKQWKEGERNYYKYKVDHPSQNFYSFMSARYEIKKRKWKDIDIEVYYDKKHPQNVDMMLNAVERSLDYYTKHFGPYYHKQCRIIEFPRYANFAQAFPGTMPYSESIGFVINMEDETENNIVDAVIAHEMAHQWWAHQVIGATMQGGTMLSESFAEYSSLMTMKSISKTPMKMRDFLKYDHNRYLRGRSIEVDIELPLYKVENQTHIHYGKGSVILYALQDYVGEEKVNTALRNFLEEYRYRKPPYPTTLDFLRHLEPQIPDSLQYLIHDWFKVITLFDCRLEKATYKKSPNGKYAVTMDIEVTKMEADTIGNETKVALHDWIDIGVFTDKDEEHLLFEQRVFVDKPKMTFKFEVDSVPARAAIDPRRLLVDRVYDDNGKSLDKVD